MGDNIVQWNLSTN